MTVQLLQCYTLWEWSHMVWSNLHTRLMASNTARHTSLLPSQDCYEGQPASEEDRFKTKNTGTNHDWFQTRHQPCL